eukprot:2912252-Prymnesium_polylepis.1
MSVYGLILESRICEAFEGHSCAAAAPRVGGVAFRHPVPAEPLVRRAPKLQIAPLAHECSRAHSCGGWRRCRPARSAR